MSDTLRLPIWFNKMKYIVDLIDLEREFIGVGVGHGGRDI